MAEKIPCTKCGREKYFEGLCYQCNCEIEKTKYETMSTQEVADCIKNIIKNIDNIKNFGKEFDDFKALLAYHDINTQNIAQVAFDHKIYYPAELYRDASPSVQDGLLELLDQVSHPELNLILNSLAVCGGEKICAYFYELENNPKAWQEKLNTRLSDYAHLGGWSFDENGNLISLIYKDCYAILPSKRNDNAIKVGVLTEGKCQECGCDLVNILEIDGTDKRLSFLNINGKVKLPICINCASLSEKIIIRYMLNGTANFEIINSFAEDNYIASKDIAQIQKMNLTLSLDKKPIYYSCGGHDVAHIGGLPNWVQDTQYEPCPDCGKTTKILGSIPWECLLDWSEGTLYLLHCKECKVVIGVHQQT